MSIASHSLVCFWELIGDICILKTMFSKICIGQTDGISVVYTDSVVQVLPYRLKVNTENLATWLKLVKFSELDISESWFLNFNHIHVL